MEAITTGLIFGTIKHMLNPGPYQKGLGLAPVLFLLHILPHMQTICIGNAECELFKKSLVANQPIRQGPLKLYRA